MADDQDHEHSFWRAVRLSRVLPADRELAAAQEIARLEVAFWQAVVEHPARARLLRLVQRTLLGVSPQAGPVAFPRRPTAVALRSLDIDQRAERAVLRVAPDLRTAHQPIAVARKEFLTANLRLVVKIARRYQGCGLDLLDLIQEGNIGLMKGLARYDYQQGVKFSTYASWWLFAARITVVPRPIALCVAFRGGVGTADMVQCCEVAGIEVQDERGA